MQLPVDRSVAPRVAHVLSTDPSLDRAASDCARLGIQLKVWLPSSYPALMGWTGADASAALRSLPADQARAAVRAAIAYRHGGLLLQDSLVHDPFSYDIARTRAGHVGFSLFSKLPLKQRHARDRTGTHDFVVGGTFVTTPRRAVWRRMFAELDAFDGVALTKYWAHAASRGDAHISEPGLFYTPDSSEGDRLLLPLIPAPASLTSLLPIALAYILATIAIIMISDPSSTSSARPTGVASTPASRLASTRASRPALRLAPSPRRSGRASRA